MNNAEVGIPFDPGYSPLSFSFAENIMFLTMDFSQMKAIHQKKFKLSQIMPGILDSINKSTAFYLGCMLWGGFINSRYKNSPKEITGNHTNKLSADEKNKLDCAEEAKFILQYIQSLHRDSKYFLNKPANVPNFVIEILNSYIEFAQINENFINVNRTDDIKLPKALSHFDKLSETQLDSLRDKIMEVIKSGKIEHLLDLGFYKI